jgi:hypothetical protein
MSPQPKLPRIEDPQHLAFIRTLPCVKCNAKPCEAAHIRRGTDGGTGRKPSDKWAVPLCHACHALQHQKGEKFFWGDIESARQLAHNLHLLSGFARDGKKYHDTMTAAGAIAAARPKFAFYGRA